jgi:hypothetical protein
LKVLLDENMSHQLRAYLPGHDVSTAVYVGFGGFRNGELLQAGEAAGFDVLLTGDRIPAEPKGPEDYYHLSIPE